MLGRKWLGIGWDMVRDWRRIMGYVFHHFNLCFTDCWILDIIYVHPCWKDYWRDLFGGIMAGG